MKSKFLRLLSVFILIISSLFFLWNGFTFYIKGFAKEHYAIGINDDNRGTIVSLLQESSDRFEEMPNIKNAIKLEFKGLMHKDEVTIHYSDQTTFVFYISGHIENPLTLYIKNADHDVYFNSSEVAIDLIKIGIPFVMVVASLIVLSKVKK